MLKSTYKPAVALPPLPAGWTEYKAPTGASARGASEVRLLDPCCSLLKYIFAPGHPYYYNAVTQQSTYTRPTDSFPQPNLQALPVTQYNSFPAIPSSTNAHGSGEQYPSGTIEQAFIDRQTPGYFRRNDTRQGSQAKDRPKSKHAIPGCEPWVLVTTRLGRRFVHNSEINESFWNFPPDVIKAVIEYDKSERERKARDQEMSKANTEASETPKFEIPQSTSTEGPLPLNGPSRVDKTPEDSDEYEEVEVTDEEEDEEIAAKRQKTENHGGEQPVEFDEDDIAYQIAAMGQDYGLDPGEYGDAEGRELEEGAEGLPLSEEDAGALFKDMLDDHHINPYKPWDKVVEEGRIIEDDRYTLLPNMKMRKEVWGEWSREKMQRLKEQRDKEEKKDPLIPYLAFLQAKATPKLYWPEFRRKYMKEPEMRSTKLSDTVREKWYRDYINRLKLPESSLKADLVSLLKSMPLHVLNRSTPMAALPPAMLTDIRYIALRPSTRSIFDSLIETHISILPEAPDTPNEPEEHQERLKQKQEREQRKALAERQMQVQREKIKAREALEYSKGMMREGEREVQQAMRVDKKGLLAYMDKEKQPPLPVGESQQVP
ncbi:MAG: hypothetical protein Q9166_000127 [cf. Caloplaca sp. 2 TL-2023]